MKRESDNDEGPKPREQHHFKSHPHIIQDLAGCGVGPEGVLMASEERHGRGVYVRFTAEDVVRMEKDIERLRDTVGRLERELNTMVHEKHQRDMHDARVDAKLETLENLLRRN